jgi:hypothetical protein
MFYLIYIDGLKTELTKNFNIDVTERKYLEELK